MGTRGDSFAGSKAAGE